MDASFLIAFFIEKDVQRKKAMEIAREIEEGRHGTAVTSDDVLDEVISVILRKEGRGEAKAVGNQIMATTFIINGDSNSLNLALNLFNLTKENFSFTDCTTQVLMKQSKIENIATFDGHFRKLDLKVLP